MTAKKYRGTLVEESLVDNRFVNTIEVHGVQITADENPGDRWHLYDVRVSSDDLARLAAAIKPEKWYAHFWSEETMFVVFPGKIFEQDLRDQSTWKNAQDYGQTLSIPLSQLDFTLPNDGE